MSKKSRARPNPGWFRRGRSGNPGGRPTASRAQQASAFDVVVEKTLTVTHQGATREITVEYRNAVAGKGMAEREVLKWILKREAWLAEHAPKASGQPIEQLSSPDPENADAALLLLGIAAHNLARADTPATRAQLLLEPWAVQAALRRRRGANRLTERELAEIQRCTRDPHSLRWPQGIEE